MGLGYYSIDELISLLKYVITSETQVIGISTTFFVEYSQRYAMFPSKLYFGDKLLRELPLLINQIKGQFPNIKLVIGGPAVRTKLQDSSNVDLFVEGYADQILVDYVLNLKSNKSLFFTQYHQKKPLLTNASNENFDFRNSVIDFHTDDNIFHNETLPLEISRGCIFKCKFCSYPLRGKSIKDNSFIKAENYIYDELISNYDKFGTTNYIFVDDTFNDNIEKLKLLHNTFKKLPFDINFAAYIRADLLNAFPESIDLLQEMGIKGAFFGIESLNPIARKASAKGFDSNKLLNTLEKVNVKWDNVVITSSFIYGLPNDSVDTIKDWTERVVFNSGIFDKHDLIFQPLFLQGNTSTFVSDFDLEMDKYNYKFTHDNQVWANGITTFREMSNLAKTYNQKAAEIKRPFSSFHAVTLLGYGLSMEQILNMDSHSTTDIELVENMTIERYKKYYELCQK